MSEFKNKVIIVTGATNGIGKAIATQFHNLGSKVIIIDKETNIDTPCDFFYQGDLTKEQIILDFSKEIINKYKKIDFLVNNAGLSKGGLLSCDYENFLYVQKLSLAAPFMLTKSFINYFNQNASIVNIASTRAFQSQEDWESYGAAKGGIIALTHAMSVTLKGKVRVNCISPGWIDTTNGEFSKEDKNQHSVKRVGKTQDIANAVMFLCSEKSSFITGENITIDGGMSKTMIYHNDYGWTYSDSK